MLKHKRVVVTIVTLAIALASAFAQDTNTKPKALAPVVTKASTNAVRRVSVRQADVASKTAKFGTISKMDETYKNALDAHALDAALKQANKDGAFKGKVTKIFEPNGGMLAIVNFDANYKSALTALLKKENFDKFPALTNLVDKEVLVTGKFTNFQNRSEIILTNTAQIKVAE